MKETDIATRLFGCKLVKTPLVKRRYDVMAGIILSTFTAVLFFGLGVWIGEYPYKHAEPRKTAFLLEVPEEDAASRSGCELMGPKASKATPYEYWKSKDGRFWKVWYPGTDHEDCTAELDATLTHLKK